VDGNTLGRIFGGAMISVPVVAWLRVRSDWRGGWIWSALVAVVGFVTAWFGIFALATGTRVFFGALSLFAGAALLRETYRRLRAWRRNRQASAIEGPRVSAKVVNRAYFAWFVVALTFLVATFRTGSTILALLCPVVWLGGWLLLLYLQRAPRRDWILAWLIWVPFLVGIYAQHPAASFGYALLAGAGAYWVWPRLRHRRAGTAE
jgi:hypothetical protein